MLGMLGKGVDALKNWDCDQKPGLFLFFKISQEIKELLKWLLAYNY